MDATLFHGFTQHLVEVAPGVNINTITAGSGAPLLLLHGHPQVHAIRHKIARAEVNRNLCDCRSREGGNPILQLGPRSQMGPPPPRGRRQV